MKEKINKVPKLKELFKGVSFGEPHNPKFYSHLFFVPPRDFKGDLPASSLFNIQTLQTMFDTFSTVPDLSVNPDGDVDFDALSGLTAKLGLDCNKQTYLLGIWLKHLYEDTGMRKADGGNKKNMLVIQLAMDSMKKSLDWMSTEFPSILYANIIYNTNKNDNKTCNVLIKSWIREVEEYQVPLFCNDTLLDLMSPQSIAFYNSIYFTGDQDKVDYLSEVTELSESQLR